MFSSFRFEAKQSEKTFISFRLEAKRKNRKRNEAKRKIFGNETKRNYGVLISLWMEAKNSKRKEAKLSEKKIDFFRVSVRNGSRFASFRFEAKTFLKRNRRTLHQCSLELSMIINGGGEGVCHKINYVDE